MFSRIKTRVAAALAAFSFLASSLVVTPLLNAQTDESASRHSLEGAWWVTVTQYDCSTGSQTTAIQLHALVLSWRHAY